MQYECSKHGMTEFTEPNANRDCFCKLCAAEVPECNPPHLNMSIMQVDRANDIYFWGQKGDFGAAKT